MSRAREGASQERAPGARDGPQSAAAHARAPSAHAVAPAAHAAHPAHAAPRSGAETLLGAQRLVGNRAVRSRLDAVHRAPGRPLGPALRAFFEPRLGADLSQVRVHTGERAADAARAVGARAYALGGDVVFGAKEWSPDTHAGRRLLAHELAHVVQPTAAAAPPLLQRTVHEGTDHGGRYAFDDTGCTLAYEQDWFFDFRTTQTEGERTSYMTSAETQVHDVWSGRHPLLPDRDDCPCSDGVTVSVNVHGSEAARGSRRGFDAIVTEDEARGFANQPLRELSLGTEHEHPLNMGEGLTQRRVAHEFGHTIGLTDEYHDWARFFGTEGSRDEPSIMHHGDEVRPRHYQHFADLLNLELGGTCTYRPAGRRLREYENPVNRFTGLPFTFLPPDARQMFGLQFDRRLSNEAIFGLAYPTAGVMTILDASTGEYRAGPTVGLRLNQLAHPLFVDVRTGLLFDLEDPERAFAPGVSLSATVGLRGSGYELGVGYTGVADLLNEGGWTHLVGVGFEVELPAWLR